MNKSGIYIIQSSVNRKRYVGSAVNLKRRKGDHWSRLINGYHPNRHLQNHVNKHGIEVLNFSILKYCKIEILIKREQYYLDTLKPEFNITSIAGSNLNLRHSEQSKRKISKSLTGKLRSEEHQKKLKEIHNKIIYQFDKHTRLLLQKFNSVVEAAKSISENIIVAQSSIAKCARGKYKSAYGYYWSYTKL